MSYIQPNSTVILLRGINTSPDNQLYFENRQAQTLFFTTGGHIVKTLDKAQFVRGTSTGGVIKVPYTFEECHRVNYMAFKNESFLDKWFYAWVTDINYVNNVTTELTYVVDDLQSWIFDTTFRPCMIERQHVSNDRIYSNLEEEGLSPSNMRDLMADNLDDNIYHYDHDYDNATQDYVYDTRYDSWRVCTHKAFMLIQADFDVEAWCFENFLNVESDASVSTTRYPQKALFKRSDGTFDTVGLYAIPLDYCCKADIDDRYIPSNGDYGLRECSNYGDGALRFVKSLQINGWIDHIQNIWVYPACLLKYGHINNISEASLDGVINMCYTVTGVRTNELNESPWYQPLDYRSIELPSATQIKATMDYIPRNNKCFNYPFTQYVITNSNGSAIELRPELFGDKGDLNKPVLRVLGNATADAKIRIVPTQYGNNWNEGTIDHDFALDSAPQPSMMLTGDTYNIWLAQNRNSIMNQFDQMKQSYLKSEIGSMSSFLGHSIGNVNPNAVSKSKIPEYPSYGWENRNDVVNTAGFNRSTGMTTLVGRALSTSVDMYFNTTNAIAQMEGVVTNTEDMRQRPATACGVQSSTIAQQNGKKTFFVKVVQCVSDRLKQIDDYFTMCGYAINKIDVPNIHVRSHWTYVKTAGCNFTTLAPKRAEISIRNMFDNGITFWVHNNEIGDYTLENDIIE